MENNPTTAQYVEPGSAVRSPNAESSSGVAWGAVIGGAFVTAAIALIMLALGAGFGLSTVSPWSNIRSSAATIGSVGIIWLIFIEIVASGLGGYLTGRLRTKWVLIHTDEVYFRDTANGFLSWAVALVLTVTFLTSAAMSMVGAVEASPDATGAMPGVPDAYFIDMLFRTDRVTTGKDMAAQAEAARIFDHALKQGDLPAGDRSYLATLIATNTGITLPEAQKRISDTFDSARETEDTARKATAHLLLWTFICLLTGAFSASYAATIGGRQRDHVRMA